MSTSVKIVNNRAIGTTHDNVGKRRDDFSSTERMANWAGNRKWTDGYLAISDKNVEENDTTNLWKTMDAASEDVFNELYKSVANLSDNVANLDLCTVSVLKDRAKEYGIDAGIMRIWSNFPVEIAKMVDLFSINKAHLRGVIEEWSNGTRKYALTTIASEKLWQMIVDECSDDETYRKFIRNTFYNTLESFVNLKPASGGDTAIWDLNGASRRRFSTDLFFSRIEYANPVEASYNSGSDSGSTDADKAIYDRKSQLGVPRYFSEKYYADEILLGSRNLNEFTDAEQEIISMEVSRRKSLWENSGVDRYTYMREVQVLHYVRFVTLLANAIYDVGDYDIDKRKSEILDLDESKYLIRSDGGQYHVDYSMIESVADVLTDYCINVSYFRETVRVQAQKNMLKGTKALLVDSIREILAKNVYSVYGGSDNFWRQTNVNGVVGLGVEMPKDLDIDVIEYIDNTRYTNIYAKVDDDKDKVNSRFWQISGVQGDLDPDDVLDFYNRLTDYKDPWKIFECANSTENQNNPKYNLYQYLNYVFNSGAFSANLTDLVFDTETVAERLAPSMTEIYGYDEIVSLLRGATTSAEVPGRLYRVFFDYDTAAGTLVDAFEEIDCGDPQYKPDDPESFTDEYAAVWNRYHDFDTIRDLISSYKTPDEFIANANSIFPSAYFDTIKSKDFLYGKIVYEPQELSSGELTNYFDIDGNLVSSTSSIERDIATSSFQSKIIVSGGYTKIVTLSGNSVSVLPDKPYVALTGLDNSFDTAWQLVLDVPEYRNPERVHEAFYYVAEYPDLYEETFGDYSNFRHDDAIDAIQTIGDDFNYDAYNAVFADSTYTGTMIHETGTFGEALYNHIGDVTWGIRPFANSQNTVHPSVQVHAFVNALIEYVNSYHAIVRYLDINQPKFSTYSQTVVDRVDKLGNSIHYWKNAVDDFSGYTTDYEKTGSDADRKLSIDGPFNLDALQSLLDDKAMFIDGIKRGTNEYYISNASGTFMLNDVEKQAEINNITIYYDDICRLARKEIAKFGRDKYGNTYVLYKDAGCRIDRDKLGKLWIRKADHPLAFPGIVVDELNGKLSNVSQVSLTDNSEIEKKIIEQYKYPQRVYDDINMVGCYLTKEGLPSSISGLAGLNARCYKVDWDELKALVGEETTAKIRGSNGLHVLDQAKTQKYFTYDADGTFVESGKETSIWDSGSVTPGYCTPESEIGGYIDNVVIGDYAKGDLVMEMEEYEKVDYDSDSKFTYKLGHTDDAERDVKELTFVVCRDNANVSSYSNNFFLDEDGKHSPITYHELTIYGIYTILLDGDNERTAEIEMSTSANRFTLSKIEGSDGSVTNIVGSMAMGGDDTNEIVVDFNGTKQELTTGIATIDGNGQNIGKYYDFTLNETLDVILLDAKDPHFEGYDKSWALDATINQPGNTDGTVEIQFFKDSQHNVEYVRPDDSREENGMRLVGIHCGNVNAGNRVHAVFARIGEKIESVGSEVIYVPTKQVSFSCKTFGYDTYTESNFAPSVAYPPFIVGNGYHFRVNSDDSKVYVAFCSSQPGDSERVGNYVSGYDGMVAGSTKFGRCSSLVHKNGVTIVGFDVVKKGLASNGDVRYVLGNETIGYYPQYSGLIGRNMTYANNSMVGRDKFGFELMFDKISGGAEKLFVNSDNLMGDTPISVSVCNRYDGGLFLEYRKYDGWIDGDTYEDKSSFVFGDNTVLDVDLDDSSFYAMGYGVSESDGKFVKDYPFAIGFRDNIVAAIAGSTVSGYNGNLPVFCKSGAENKDIDVVLEDVDYDEDGVATATSISMQIVEVSNVDVNGNFIVLCRDNYVLSCHYDIEANVIYIKSVTEFVMDDSLDQIDNSFDGKFVVYPSKLTSGKINFIHASTNPAGYLDVGYYVTEYADTATIKDVEVFEDSAFVIFGATDSTTNVDHVFRVGNCFDSEQKCVEEFIMLDESSDGYSGFASDDDHLFLVPATLGGTVLIYNAQTGTFDDAYELGRLIPSCTQYSKIIQSRIMNEKLKFLVNEVDNPNTAENESLCYKEFYVNIGSDCNYAILELDKGFPILVTYDIIDDVIPSHPGMTADDRVRLNFQCLFNTSSAGRTTHSLYSWERGTVDFAYNKSTESGKEFDAEERYGTVDNEYVYGDSRVYRITATGDRKFYIERLYRDGLYSTGEFDGAAYLSFTYDLTGYSNARRNKMFAHWNPSTTFRYTVSGPFTDAGLELGTEHIVGKTPIELAEKFKGLSISREFDTYWLSGEMLHLSSVVEPTNPEYRHLDCLVDSNLQFATNTIISSCAHMFDGHVNLLCENRSLDFNYIDNTKHINDASYMFRDDSSLVLPEVDITDCNVINTVSMFEGCTNAPLVGASFPVGLTSVERMFAGCQTATFGWDMLLPGTVVSSVSGVFANCIKGTFGGFAFGQFPRYRRSEFEEFDDEIITVQDVELGTISDNERNLNDDAIKLIWTPVKIADHNDESGRMVRESVYEDKTVIVTSVVWKTVLSAVVRENDEAGVYYELGDDESESFQFSKPMFSMDMDLRETEEGSPAPLLNFGGDDVLHYEKVNVSSISSVSSTERVIVTSGDPQSEIDVERYLSFDQDYEYDKALLNFDDEVWANISSTEEYTDLNDLNHEHGGRFSHVVENDIIADYMFFNTPKFNTNYIGFEQIAHTLCSTESMFEKCGTAPARYVENSGRFASPDDQTDETYQFQERLFSFDVDTYSYTAPLLNFASDTGDIDRGLKTFDGVVEMPNIINAKRMFRGSAFRFYDTTIRTGRAISDAKEMFRGCTCIFDRGPRIQTYDFKGTIYANDGKIETRDVPLDMRAMYAECDQMTYVDVELLGDVIDLSPSGAVYPDKMFLCDFMFFGCEGLFGVTGKLNQYATSARGMFGGCTKISANSILDFLREFKKPCNATGMFYGCTQLESYESQLLAKLGSNVTFDEGGSLFSKPSELDEDGKLPWEIFD